MIIINNPVASGGGGGSSDTTEATQLLVKAAVQAIQADGNKEVTQAQVLAKLNTLDAITTSIRQNLEYTIGYHNTGLYVVNCGNGGSYSVNYLLAAYENGVGWVTDPAKFTGLRPHEEMHIRDDKGRFAHLVWQPLAGGHDIVTLFDGFFVAV